MWMGDGNYRLAGALVTLIHQLEAAYPDQEWQNSGGTGTIGDASHRSEGSASDHNPWLNNTVRALDVAKTSRGPDCEALFRMVNQMYGAHDPRVYPYGYAIFNGRITDWNNPGGYHAQQGDQHLTHCHISVGHTGYNATNPWPIPGGVPDVTPAELRAELTNFFHGKDGKPYNIESLEREALSDVIAEVASIRADVAAIKKKVGA